MVSLRLGKNSFRVLFGNQSFLSLIVSRQYACKKRQYLQQEVGYMATIMKKVKPLHLISRKERVREGGFIARKERVREGSFMERNERVEDKVLLQFKRRRRVFHASISTHALNLGTMPNIVVIQTRGSTKPQLQMSMKTNFKRIPRIRIIQSSCWLWSMIFLIQRCYFYCFWILAHGGGMWGGFLPHYSHQGGPQGVWRVFSQKQKFRKKCLIKCFNFKVMTWSIMGDLWAHGFVQSIVFPHGIPFIKGRNCNTTMYCIVSL